MQDINLLQNKLKDKTNHWENQNRLVTVLLSLVLVGLLIAFGTFFMLTKSAEDSTVTLNQENASLKKQLDEMEDRLSTARGFQAQTKNIDTLLSNHVIWDELVDQVALHTYKVSKYISMNATTSGDIHLEGITPDYVTLGKLLLALETSESFESVRLLGLASATETAEAGVNFSILVRANQEVFLAQD